MTGRRSDYDSATESPSTRRPSLRRVRPLFSFAAFAAIALLSSALVACGGDDSPESVLDNATLQGIESAAIDLSVDASADGKNGGKLAIALGGAFQSQGEGQLPRLDLDLTAKGGVGGEDVDFDGGLVLLPNRAYVSYEGIRYEVDPTTFSFVQSALKRAESEGGEEGGACQEAFGELEVSSFVNDLSEEGSADVGGTATTVVKGELDAPAAIEAIVEAARSPACRGQLAAAGPLPSDDELDSAKSDVAEAVKGAEAEVYVGDDDIVRRIVATLAIEPPDRNPGDPSRVDLDLDLQLTGVNEPQQITAPSGKLQPLSRLFVKLGVNPIELLGLLSGEGGGPEGLGNLLEGLGGGS